MDKYIICMDASGDIDPKFMEENNVKFIPMNYTISNEYRTCKEMEPYSILKKFYDGQRSGDLTKTTQITPFQYEEFFESFLKEGLSVIYISLSSGLSNTFSCSELASKNLKEKYPSLDVYCIDSLAATGGIGVLVQQLVYNRKAGMSIKDNYEKVKELTHHIKHWFMVENLMYLKRGGRISGATAIVGSLLNFKPILEIDKEGKLETIDKKRGRKLGLKCLLDTFEAHYSKELTKDVYITHADAEASAAYLKEELLKMHPDLNITITLLSPIIGAHTGPDMATICYLGD